MKILVLVVFLLLVTTAVCAGGFALESTGEKVARVRREDKPEKDLEGSESAYVYAVYPYVYPHVPYVVVGK